MSLRLPNLPGGIPYQIAYPSWNRALLSLGKEMCISADGQGLNGFFTTNIEYQLLMGNPMNPAVHQPLVRPPELDENANGVQVARHTSFENAYLREQNALALLKTIVLNSLDAPTISILEANIIGTAGLSLRQIVETIRQRYGAVTPEIFTNYVKKTIIPYSPSSSLDDHINTHRLVHRYAADMAQPYTEHMKIESLRETLIGCGLFTQGMRTYAATYPTFALRTFQNFSDAMITEKNQSSETTSTMGYSASMNTLDPRSSSIDEKIDFLMAYMTKMVTKSSGRGGGGSGGGGKIDNTGYEYCWKHGRCRHKSADCRNKEPGHKDSATFGNKLGGK